MSKIKTDFTKQERKEIYEALLKEVDIPFPQTHQKEDLFFICWKLYAKMKGDNDIFSETGSFPYESKVMKSFPEFESAYKEIMQGYEYDEGPGFIDEYLRQQDRAAALQKAIKLCNI